MKGKLGVINSFRSVYASSLICSLFLLLVLRRGKSSFLFSLQHQEHRTISLMLFGVSGDQSLQEKKAWFRLQFPVLTLTETCSLFHFITELLPCPPALPAGVDFMEEFSFKDH